MAFLVMSVACHLCFFFHSLFLTVVPAYVPYVLEVMLFRGIDLLSCPYLLSLLLWITNPFPTHLNNGVL